MAARIIDGKRIAAEVRAEAREECLALLNETGVQARIVFVLVGDSPASEVYVRNKGIAAEEAGFSHDTLKFPATISEAELIDVVYKINDDSKTHGLLVQLPLPKHIREAHIIEAIDPAKDVDGLHPINAGHLSSGTGQYFAPCTPAGVVEMLYREGIKVEGQHVVIVGRSNLVGKPLALLLAQKTPKTNAVVTLAHTGAGQRLKEFTQQADILIAAMGAPRAITAEMVKPGAVVIDIGMNRVPDASTKSGTRLVGDVDFDSVSQIASAITPVPGGVGPMTIAMLLKNTVEAARRASKKESS
jgi:methylenetetrahydrofolate dehydrogenase (NADP+)/methenyltetrahydrofolate cyclohydrolase